MVRKGEPEWLEDDRSWALGLLAEEADRCSGCGNPLSETTATAIDKRTGKRGPAHLYEAEAMSCAGCAAVASALDVDAPASPALKWTVRQLD